MNDSEAYLNFSAATLISGIAADRVEKKAVSVLTREVSVRTGICLSRPEDSDSGHPRIIVGTKASLPKILGNYRSYLRGLAEPGPEGYRIITIPGASPAVLVVGADPRGVLYGVGRLLRLMRLKEALVEIPASLRISGTPQYPLRGHQLGYRPKNNTYDAWTPETFDQYIRELTFFGVNSIEILPPRTDDAALSPLMKTPPPEMMVRLAEIIDSYGLDVWIWYPNLGSDYRNPAFIAAELEEREKIFHQLPRIDGVFIPGGDPGELEPEVLFDWAGKVARVLRCYHPKAKIWLSPQTFQPTPDWMETFYREVQKRPDWLGGIVFGPWVKTPLPELRRIIPEQYPIRNYPDIAHNYHCQFPAPDWDPAFAMTLGRECINPRPVAMKAIHNLLEPYTIGSLTYSEGINDDVNKFIWSAQDWDRDTPVIATLREYARVFIGPDYCESIAQGLLALERNWEGPLLNNSAIDRTLQQWRLLEQTASPQLLHNYRFLMGLFRAYYDAYLRRRLIHETELEQEALDILKGINGNDTNLDVLISQAEAKLGMAAVQPAAPDLRQHCLDLADTIFQIIGMQFSVPRHHTASWIRNAVIDDIDMPLNNSRWLGYQLSRIKELPDRREQLEAINRTLSRTHPGPGNFYDNFDGKKSGARVTPEYNPARDPGGLQSAFLAYSAKMMDSFHNPDPDLEAVGPVPAEWVSGFATMYDIPLSIHYENLDPEAAYRLRVTYLYNRRCPKIRLTANREQVIHDYRLFKGDQLQQEFILPQKLTAGGELLLTWESAAGDQGPGVAELWLIRE
jgi:hypothetical protein